ncbi:hypothetical protein HPT29_020345 [Microvirga terrae]|uniref:LPXTG cell wall anchor domain-containing protein n=1 Tax=Microvirga terrae TaxID=2740529 RepID=A0ABY5RNK4_9HYPH|nr:MULTISPECIES: hypothetical protein [Microvirga]MBQ0821672.1 hypothetical protein [Microvirga sp. HBU67558]UVF18810.1 hypothetical protein HPT29_020345 [Microvirga terrae]
MGDNPFETSLMPETDEQPDDELEELNGTKRVNFRDYPSSGLVVIAALSSGLGWMLFRWLGKKRKARNDRPVEDSTASGTSPEPETPDGSSS